MNWALMIFAATGWTLFALAMKANQKLYSSQRKSEDSNLLGNNEAFLRELGLNYIAAERWDCPDEWGIVGSFYLSDDGSVDWMLDGWDLVTCRTRRHLKSLLDVMRNQQS